MIDITELLREKRLTKVELARLMNITREHLYTLLKNPAADTCKRIALALGVSEQAVANCNAQKNQIRTISLLPLEEWRFVRQINIVSNIGQYKDISVGYILYERPLKENYTMRSRRADESESDYFLTLRSQITDYPEDYLDKIILEGIQRQYPDSYPTIHEIVADMELSTIDNLQQYPYKSFRFQLQPTYTQQIIEDAKKGIIHNYYSFDAKFYRSAPAIMSEHIVTATAVFDMPHEQEVENLITKGELKFI